MSLQNWISEDKNDDIFLILPHKSNDFDGLGKNIHIISGNYFAICKELSKRSLLFNVKHLIKRLYMFLFYQSSVKKRLIKIIQNINPDVIISNSFSIWVGADIAATLGLKHIWHVREFMELDHKISHYNSAQIQYLTQKSSAIFISHAIEKYYLTKYKFKNSKVIYNQISYNDKTANYNHIFNKTVTKAIFVGQLSIGKGIWDAINATIRVNEKGYSLILDIYGSGPLYNDIKKFLEERNFEYIHLNGFNKQITDLRREYDIALICSEMEALGRVTIEAMYYGNLVIGANTGGTLELVKNGYNGYLYECHKIDSLVNTIIKVIDLGDDNQKIIKTAHDWAVSNFSRPIANEILDYIKTC